MKRDDLRKRANQRRERQTNALNPKAAAVAKCGRVATFGRHGWRANTLDEEAQQRVFSYIDRNSRTPEIDRLKMALSFKAGLRVSEIAKLTVQDVTDAQGKIGKYIRIPAGISKSGRERLIPMHPQVRDAIKAFRTRYPDVESFGISHVGGKIRIQSTGSLTVWFHRLYQLVKLQKCSSHSGRRTFLTALARSANNFGNSLRDVQMLAGHARLDTTATYIDPTPELSDLVNSLGSKRRRRRRKPRCNGGEENGQ